MGVETTTSGGGINGGGGTLTATVEQLPGLACFGEHGGASAAKANGNNSEVSKTLAVMNEIDFIVEVFI